MESNEKFPNSAENIEDQESLPVGASFRERWIYFDAHPENIKPEYLNNLALWLPGGNDEMDYYQSRMNRSTLDGKPSEMSEEDYIQQQIKEGLSETRVRQTNREFMDAIKSAIEELGLDVEKIRELNRASKRDHDKYIELQKLMIPLYLKLREIGYTHRDLTG